MMNDFLVFSGTVETTMQVFAKFTYFILSAYSISTIICETHIFKSFREYVAIKNKTLGVLVRCMVCMGTWIGILLSIVIWSPSAHIFPHIHGGLCIFLDGVNTGCIVYILSILEQKLRQVNG